MAEEDSITWEAEPIQNFLDNHLLFRAIPKVIWEHWTPDYQIKPNFFITENALKDGLSMDWSKYSRSIDTLNRRNNPTLDNWCVSQIKVGSFKNTIQEKNLPLTIEHKPKKDPPKKNRAHTLITGFTIRNTTDIRRKIYKLVEWVPKMKPLLTE